METKKVSPVKVFYHSELTTLEGIHAVAIREIENMYAEAAKSGIKESAPMQFIYYDFDGKPGSKFTLEIAIVVDEEKPYTGKYKFKTLDGFSCVSTIHNGNVNDLGETYQKFMPEVMQSGLQLSNQSREVYHKYTEQESADNVTEIQIGVN